MDAPLDISLAVTFKTPFASILKLTTICAVARGFGGIPDNNVGGGGRWGDSDILVTDDEVWNQVYYKNFIIAKDLIKMFLVNLNRVMSSQQYG